MTKNEISGKIEAIERERKVESMASITLKINDMLGISTIGYSNTRRFGDIKQELNKYAPDDEIILDFKYVNIEDTHSDAFKDLITDRRVKFIIYNNKELQTIINFIAIMASDDVPKDKVTLIENIGTTEKLNSKVEKEVERYLLNFEANAQIVDDTYCINVDNVVSFIDRDSILDAIFALIDRKKDTHKKFRLKLGCISIANEQIKVLAKRICKYLEILGGRDNLRFNSNNAALDLDIEQIISTTKQENLSPKDRANVLLNELGINTVGLLISYVNSNKKDMHGRRGNGQIATSLPCKFIGIQDDCAIFKVFRANTFKTKEDYREEHDNEELLEMASYTKTVELSELGICNYCGGSSYHFNLPVQWGEEGYQYTYYWQGNGLNRIKVTLPQFFMMVLDCWGEKYNYEVLVDCIKISKNNLRNSDMH